MTGATDGVTGRVGDGYRAGSDHHQEALVPEIDRTVVVEGDQQQVWDYLADFTTTEDWDPPTQRTERVRGDGGVGTVYRNVSRLLGRDTEVTYEVVRHEAPRRLELDGRAGSMKLHDTLTVEQDGPRVRVRYRAEFHPEGPLKLATPLMPPALKKLGDEAASQMEECLRRL